MVVMRTSTTASSVSGRDVIAKRSADWHPCGMGQAGKASSGGSWSILSYWRKSAVR